MKKVRIVVDEDLCIGAASCVTVTPEIFQLNDENKAIVLDQKAEDSAETYERWWTVSDDEYDNLVLSAQSCPTLAIFIFDEEGTQLFPDM